ncbi:MAG: hypothetical protein EDM75_13195, partial [Chlorobiota bacterium]
MLNYIWAILIFLGFLSAVYYDAADTATSRHKNGVPVTVTVTETADGKAEVVLDSVTLSRHFGVAVNTTLTASIPLEKQTKEEIGVSFKVPDDAAEVLKEIAKASGKENDITATVTLAKGKSETVTASVLLEPVSFRKIKDITNAAISFA